VNSKYSTNFIVDSSVIAKWFFPSEKDIEKALEIKELFLSHEISISAPSLIYYEINNLLRTAIKTLRINEKLAEKAYLGFLDLDIVTYSSKELMVMTLEKAVSFDISSYDASYIALSEYLNLPFVTADQRLIDKVKNDLVVSLKKF